LKKKPGIKEAMDPLDAALEAKEKLADARKEKELATFQQWKADPNPQTTQAWMKHLEPTFRSFEQHHRAPRTSKPAMRVLMQEQALKASESYDPTRGTAPTSWVHSNLRRAQRFNIQQQNVAKMSEENVRNIGRIKRGTETLRDQLGRDPTEAELVANLNLGVPARRQLTPQKIRTIRTQASRRDLPGSEFESDPMPTAARQDQEIVSLMPQRFQQQGKRDHLRMMDVLYNEGVESTGAIAKRLGWSNSKVSRIRTDIENEYRKVKKQPLRQGRKKKVV
jgi:DNA-directed RNA polymerase specialized sigma subunit